MMEGGGDRAVTVVGQEVACRTKEKDHRERRISMTMLLSWFVK